MIRFAGLAALLAVALPASAAAQDGQWHIVKYDAEAFVALRIIDPVMGHGIATYFYTQPRSVGGQQGVHFQSVYVIAHCDERTIRLGPDTYFNGEGIEIGERALSNSTFTAVQPGSLEADLLDVECLNKRARITIPPTVSDKQLLDQYLEAIANDGQ